MGGLLGLPRACALGSGWSLRLLPALEELEARREGEALADGEREKALCMNACLVAHALCRNGAVFFESGRAVLEQLTAGQIAVLARRWSEFDRENNPKPWEEARVNEAKKGWSIRLTRVFSGVCFKISAFFRARRGRGR